MSVTEDPAVAAGATEVTRTIVFIDLAGYTALVEAHGDEAAVEVSEALVRVAGEQLCDRGTLIKSIGDAVMLGFETAEVALRTVRDILERLADEPSFPLPSTGMHHGPVMERNGDLFGRRVNIAARLASAAAPGQVLCTRVVADIAASAGVVTVDNGPLRLRHITDPIPTFVLRLGASAAEGVDPVCRMRVGNDDHRLEHGGRTWRFCSSECEELFVSRPGDFI